MKNEEKYKTEAMAETLLTMRLLWSDAPEKEVASLDGNMVRVGRHVHVFESEQLAKVAYEAFVKVIRTLSCRFEIYNMGSDHGLVIFERWY